MTVRQAPLGVNQVAVLQCLKDHGGWPGSWTWENPSLTRRILDSLVRRGLVDTEEVTSRWGHTFTRYTARDSA